MLAALYAGCMITSLVVLEGGMVVLCIMIGLSIVYYAALVKIYGEEVL